MSSGLQRKPAPQSIDLALRWHSEISQSVMQHRASALGALQGVQSTASSASLTGLTEPEVEQFFENQQAEVDGMCIVNIMAAAEATIRHDYRQRVHRHQADSLSKAYVALKKKQRGRKAHLPDFDEGGILEALKDSSTVQGHLVTSFRHALKIRHWYAHGRHWPLKTNALHDPAAVHLACKELLDAIPPFPGK